MVWDTEASNIKTIYKTLFAPLYKQLCLHFVFLLGSPLDANINILFFKKLLAMANLGW